MQPNTKATKINTKHPLAGDQRGEQPGEADAGAEVGDQLVVAEVASGQHDAAGQAGEATGHQHGADAVPALGDTGALGGPRVAAEHAQPEPDDRAVEDEPHAEHDARMPRRTR